MHREVEESVRFHLHLIDRWLPDRLCGFYLVGSVALDGYRLGLSDIDFIGAIDGHLSDGELRRMRYIWFRSGYHTATKAMRLARTAEPVTGQPIFGGCNGVYVRETDLSLPVSQIVPLAWHSGFRFRTGAAFDVNPVVWHELKHHGVAILGDEPGELSIDPEPHRLRPWNLEQLNHYWSSFATKARTGRAPQPRRSPRWLTAKGVLGTARMHRTVTTGEVITKEAAGEHALEAFGDEWRSIVHEAVFFREGRGTFDHRFDDDVSYRYRRMGEFMQVVIDDANRVANSHPGLGPA